MEFHRIFERLIPDRAVKTYLRVLALIFFAGFLTGIVAPVPVRKELSEAFRTLAEQYLDLSGGTLFLFILVNNVFASLLLLVSGLLLGVLPILSVGFNGFVLGIFYRLTSGVEGYGKAALGVLPHGIFEIPALLVAASYGVWLGMAVLRRIRRKETAPLGGMINHALERYFVVVFPLLVVAAAVETSVILWAV
jgi:stage II sporulation protein M